VQPGSGKLTRLFLYTLPTSHHARPPNIPEAQWQHALRKAGGAANKAKLWPLAIQGLGGLREHRAAQRAGSEGNAAYLSELRAAVARCAEGERRDVRRRAEAVLRTHAEQAHRLLKARSRQCCTC
jgi:Nucleoporin complex subunit 54